MRQTRNAKKGNGKAIPAMSRFLSEMVSLRKRARQEIMQEAVPASCDIDPAKAARVLNIALSIELFCVLRYRQHHFVAAGIHAEPESNDFLEHSNEELGHADRLAERIAQLGGTPELDPTTFVGQPRSEYVTCNSLEAMIKENIIAERIAVEVYREMVAFFGERDPVTCSLLEDILAVEDAHADELAELLEAK